MKLPAARRVCSCWIGGNRNWTIAIAAWRRIPVFVALESTIREFEIPSEPFRDLLVAFRQDQNRNRYETFNDLLDYCRNSANPVGRLVLYLGRCHDEPRGQLSDSICTGLQLANFWQDVARDYCDRPHLFAAGKLPPRPVTTRRCLSATNSIRNFAGCWPTKSIGPNRSFAPANRWSRKCRAQLRVDIRLFIDGGLAILKAIRRIDFNVWHKRPTVGRGKKLRLLAPRVVAGGACLSQLDDSYAFCNGWPGGRRRISIFRFCCCRDRNAAPCMRCMRFCGTWTT